MKYITLEKEATCQGCGDLLQVGDDVGLFDGDIHCEGCAEDIEDDEWVYWCMDDRYPIGINKPHLVNIYDWIKSLLPNN